MRSFGVGLLLFATVSLAIRADTSGSLNSCVTRRVVAHYPGPTWVSQTVCQGNEIAVSGGGFCPGRQMVGASTTQSVVDRQVWLWCTSSGPAYWYGVCCQTQTPPAPPPAVKSCVTRRVFANYSGSTWLPQTVCQGSEIAVSGGGFCPGRQMVGASTTQNVVDNRVWLWCTGDGQSYWYGVCCQT